MYDVKDFTTRCGRSQSRHCLEIATAAMRPRNGDVSTPSWPCLYISDPSTGVKFA